MQFCVEIIPDPANARWHSPLAASASFSEKVMLDFQPLKSPALKCHRRLPVRNPRSTFVKEAIQSRHIARFESFEVNLRSGELLKHGERIKLPEQSFQILAMLLERPGEVVMRPEIQKRLWPNDTVVEFENSINAAIKRLRVALGDSADKPRYIETLARRGYRWRAAIRPRRRRNRH